jgi:hypothetical protein
MIAAPRLRIPKAEGPVLKLLATMPDDAFSQLAAALSQLPESLEPDSAPTRIAGQVTSLDPADTKAIVESLLTMYVISDRLGVDVPTFVDSIRRSIDESTELADFEPREKDQLLSRLAILLRYDEGIGLSSKALGLSGEYGNLFVRSRILTDMRPVFGSNLVAGPQGAIISHTLHIECHQADGEHTSFFITMDSSDLDDLREQLDRAVQKETALRAMLKSTQVRLFSDETEEIK